MATWLPSHMHVHTHAVSLYAVA